VRAANLAEAAGPVGVANLAEAAGSVGEARSAEVANPAMAEEVRARH